MKSFPFLLLLLLIQLSITTFSQDTINMDEKTFVKVDEEASYPGGEAAWRRFLERTASGTVPSDNGAPVGQYTIIAQFIVDVDGTISGLKALTNEGFGMEAELLRVMRKSGLWNQAMKDGKPVKAYRKQPMTFVVMDEFEIASRGGYALYIGMDNEITFTLGKLKSKDIQLTISEGTIMRMPDGKYIARVNRPGRVTIDIRDIKKNQSISVASFEVKVK